MDYALLGLSIAVIGAGLIVSVERRFGRVERRIARIERRLESIADHLGIPESTPELGQVEELLRGGQKIRAIRVYREITGADLKEAKDAVERIAAQR